MQAMIKILKYVLIPTIFLGWFSSTKANSDNTNVLSDEPPSIELPDIPASLTSPTERADYLLLHFWDKLDSKDTLKSHDRQLLEQTFVNFLSVMPYVTSDSTRKEGFVNMLKQIEPDVYLFRVMKDTADDYLFDPNSPMFSEEIYLLFLEALMHSPLTSHTDQIRLADLIEMIGKNMRGSQATDFSFIKKDGTQSTLLQSLGANETLLIFFDPDCEHCDEILNMISSDAALSRDVKLGKKTILAIYSGDNLTSWKRKVSQMPPEWTIGINENEIEDNDLYFLPSMPTIYLLDNKGIVLEKDLQFE